MDGFARTTPGRAKERTGLAERSETVETRGDGVGVPPTIDELHVADARLVQQRVG